MDASVDAAERVLKVWGRVTSINVQKVMWAIGELGLACERVDVGGAHGGLDTPAYAALNPNRRIPTLEDGGFVLWESNAIVRYLGARYGTDGFWPRSPLERAIADQWMDWQQTTLLPDMRAVFWGLVRTPPEQRDARRIAEAVESLASLWSRLDAHLRKRPFVAGERLTMGDVPVGAMFYRYRALGIARPELAGLDVWYERLSARAPYRMHVMLPLE